MYERSVIVLERYMEDILGLNKQNNMKNNFYTYKGMVEEIKIYQNMLEEEEDVLTKFDDVAKRLQGLQKEEEILYKSSETLENQRHNLFSDLDIRPDLLEKKLIRIENQIDKNNEELKQIRRDYVEIIDEFIESQKNRNICARKKKGTVTNHITTIEKTRQLFEIIDKEDIKRMKHFVDGDKSLIKEQIFNIMMDNGRNERVSFNENVIRKAIEVRMDIGTREAKCYLIVYDKLRKLLKEVEDDNLLISKYEKTLRDTSVKLRFLDAEKDYIVGFLDNERMTAINGEIVHEKMMDEACADFDKDINQIDKLYELIKKETTGKATDNDYNRLYNNTYLRDIEESAKSFEKQITNVKISVGTVINSNYWRIQGIKNVYTAFREEVPEKFDRNLSEYEEDENEEGYEVEQLINESDPEYNEEEENIIEEKDDDVLNDLEKYEEDEFEFEKINEEDEEDKLERENKKIKENNEDSDEKIEILDKENDDEAYENNDDDDDYFQFGAAYDSKYNEKMQEIEAKKRKIKNIKPIGKMNPKKSIKKRKIRRPKISGYDTENQNKIDEFMQNISEEEEKREKEKFINKLLNFNKDKNRLKI